MPERSGGSFRFLYVSLGANGLRWLLRASLRTHHGAQPNPCCVGQAALQPSCQSDSSGLILLNMGDLQTTTEDIRVYIYIYM